MQLAFIQPGTSPGVLFLTVLAVAAAFLIVAILTRLSKRTRSRAIVRLDHFLPFVRKRRFPPGDPSLLVRCAQRLLPKHWFFDPVTGSEGALRRWCRQLGPTVLAAPLRRVIQGICFLTFSTLFFYVCWPYDARPVSEGAASPGWIFQGLDQASGEIRFSRDPVATENANINQIYAQSSSGTSSWPLEVISLQEGEATFSVPQSETAEILQVLMLGTSPWTFFESEPDKWPSHYADNLRAKERLPADLFLVLDPLVSISTAIASRSWVWSLSAAGIILVVCVLIPRGFCGYLCPLGTLIDLFDGTIGKHVTRFRVGNDGWWVHLKYYLLAGVLISAVMGVLISGFVAAIPVITRGFLFLIEPLQTGSLRSWHLIPGINAGHFLSLFLFVSVLALGFLRPRFWCKYVCPSGAVFSLGNLFRATERKVESSCIHCDKCVRICPFDAIKPDFTTRGTDCTLCQTCAGVCPTHAIKFVERWNTVDLKEHNVPPTGETALGRRGFLSLTAGSTAAVLGGAGVATATKVTNPDANTRPLPVRPPGSVPEESFLQMCIRCGECFKACPNNVLQSLGFSHGLGGLWTPAVAADWAGCESSCNACGEVCPTGAIRALPLSEKKDVRMGLAMVNTVTCLPFAHREACQLCVDECTAAGYHAIEFTRVGTQTDAEGRPIEGSGYLAPLVIPDKCVGCGLCQTRCFGINVEAKGLLESSAIVIEAGSGKEDRFTDAAYEEWQREREQKADISTPSPAAPIPQDDPFGL